MTSMNVNSIRIVANAAGINVFFELELCDMTNQDLVDFIQAAKPLDQGGWQLEECQSSDPQDVDWS